MGRPALDIRAGEDVNPFLFLLSTTACAMCEIGVFRGHYYGTKLLSEYEVISTFKCSFTNKIIIVGQTNFPHSFLKTHKIIRFFLYRLKNNYKLEGALGVGVRAMVLKERGSVTL